MSVMMPMPGDPGKNHMSCYKLSGKETRARFAIIKLHNIVIEF
jgi:hypothetical protein